MLNTFNIISFCFLIYFTVGQVQYDTFSYTVPNVENPIFQVCMSKDLTKMIIKPYNQPFLFYSVLNNNFTFITQVTQNY
jgi:hypothetical protein